MDDAWLLFPLALIVMMTGANPLSPVPLLMLLLMTNTLTRLLPNPIPVLDYPVIDFATAPPAALSQSTAQLQRQGTAAQPASTAASTAAGATHELLVAAGARFNEFADGKRAHMITVQAGNEEERSRKLPRNRDRTHP